MRKTQGNVKVLAENIENTRGFNIYLEFSGQREYLMSHRHNGLLYQVLKDGVYVEEIRRWKSKGVGRRTRANGSQQLQNMVSHLLSVIDEYVDEREAC